MTDPARGPTTEELRARVLAQLEADARAQDAVTVPAMLEATRPLEHDARRLEGRTFYDPARPPLDSEGAERPQTTTERSAPMRYCVNATLTVPAYIYVDADSPEAALEAARDYRAQDFESDMGGAEVEFNVTPSPELVNA